MKKKVFNKLVRDKTPEIIKSNGESCKTRILDTNEYLAELNTKLKEELNEYLNAKDNSDAIEELADLEDGKTFSPEGSGRTFRVQKIL